MRFSEQQKQEAQETLREFVTPGTTVYTVLRHVSRSGMSRLIDLYVMQDGEPRWISSLAARATGISYDEKKEAMRLGGCGMDMGFAAVYELSHALYPDGFGCTGERCPSNDHSNGDRDYTPHMPEDQRRGATGELCTCHKEHWHKSGGYALRHKWM